MQIYKQQKTFMHHTSFMYKHRLAIAHTARARQALHLQQTSIHTAGHTKHAYACPSNYSPIVDSIPRGDHDRLERGRLCGCWRGGEYVEAPPHQLSINQSRFNYKKWRKIWAKWDGREGGDELGGCGRRMKWVVVGRGLPSFVDLERHFCGAWASMRHRNMAFLWRIHCHAPQNMAFLWRTNAHAPLNIEFLWRTQPHAPHNYTEF